MVTTNKNIILIKQDKQQHLAASCSPIASLETALDEFTKLRIEGDCKLQTNCKTMRRTGIHYYNYNKCRFSPYQIPKSNIEAIRKYLCSLVIKQFNKDDFHQDLLVNIQLKGCNFYGRSLQKNIFNITKKQALPCWLQHNKKRSLIWRKSKEEENLKEENFPSSSSSVPVGVEIDNNLQENEEKQDLGLTELSDYFQHFVCLCSPKMSDLAQSMYA
uniref:Oxidative stress-responsive serine-rich protein 1 n=1 Tax=Meloidogyne floridensis TaxID=298350 RepID=A0A915P1I4_9BILA